MTSNSDIREIDWSCLCLQHFGKFLIWREWNDRKRKLFESTETFWWIYIAASACIIWEIGIEWKLEVKRYATVKNDFEIREINWSYPQHFGKFLIWREWNDRKRKLSKSTEICLENFVKSHQLNYILVVLYSYLFHLGVGDRMEVKN